MKEQMQMAFMEEGGLRDDGMNNDPVSGNEVPSGSMAKEVRDDIPAQLSEGEYVVPADVVRYYGIKFFEDLREMAKIGLQDMENNGRIGGEPVAAGAEPELSQEEMQAIQQMMGMAEGGAINAYRKQQSLYAPSNSAVGNPNIETGTQVQGFNTGTTGATSSQVEQNLLNQGAAAQAENYTGAPLGFSLFESQNQQPQSLPFTPVNMIHPETFVRAVATTPEMKKSLEDQGYIVDDGSLQPPEQTGGGSGKGGGSEPPETEKTDPMAWAKDLNAANSMEWVNSNLTGEKAGGNFFSNITLAKNYARSAALARVAEAQGNTELAGKIRGVMKTAYDNNQFLRMMPGELIDGSSIQTKIEDTIDLSIKKIQKPKKDRKSAFDPFKTSAAEIEKQVAFKKKKRKKSGTSAAEKAAAMRDARTTDKQDGKSTGGFKDQSANTLSSADRVSNYQSDGQMFRGQGGRAEGGLMTKGKKKKK